MSETSAASCSWAASWAAAIGFALATLWLVTRHNDFPFFCHTDEPGKVRQVIKREYNFHHPLLLLKATDLLARATGTPAQPQPIVLQGRLVSATFEALAVAAIVLLGCRLGGMQAGALCGLLGLTHPTLFELAHYMKEDCSLLVGLAWSFVAMRYFSERPTLGRAALMGAAAGVAASGKYIGLLAVLPAVLTLIFSRGEATPALGKSLGLFLAGFAVAFGVINLESLLNLGRASQGLGSEFDAIDNRENEREGFGIRYLSKFGSVISVPVLLGAVYWLRERWRERRGAPAFWWILGSFPLLVFAVICCAPITKDRYMAPIYLFACLLGALGLAEFMARAMNARLRGLGWAVAALAVGWHLFYLIGNYRSFSVDDHTELFGWIREHLPANAVVAHDRRTRLSEAKTSDVEQFGFPQRILTSHTKFAADLGSLAELRRQGVTDVAVSEQDYHAVLRDGHDPRRDFYLTLFQQGKLLFETKARELAYLHPGLRLYDITSIHP